MRVVATIEVPNSGELRVLYVLVALSPCTVNYDLRPPWQPCLSRPPHSSPPLCPIGIGLFQPYILFCYGDPGVGKTFIR